MKQRLPPRQTVKLLLLALTLTALLLSPSASIAQSTGYSAVQGGGGGRPGNTSGDGSPGQPVSVSSNATPGSTTGDLPYTGLDAAVVLVAAASLIGTGLILRRKTKPSSGA